MKILATIVLFTSLNLVAADAVTVPTIFQISNGKRVATAFYISPTKLLTAAHTFKGDMATPMTLVRDGKIVTCALIKIDTDKDIAVLETTEPNADFLTLDKYGTLTTIGIDQNGKVVKSTVNSTRHKTDNVCSPGMSGCPILNGDGKVVGMGIRHAMFSSKGCTWITADELSAFVESK